VSDGGRLPQVTGLRNKAFRARMTTTKNPKPSNLLMVTQIPSRLTQRREVSARIGKSFATMVQRNRRCVDIGEIVWNRSKCARLFHVIRKLAPGSFKDWFRCRLTRDGDPAVHCSALLWRATTGSCKRRKNGCAINKRSPMLNAERRAARS